MHKTNEWRKFLLPRLRRGEISMTEAAWLAGISRQAVAKWCKAASLHMKGMRHEWLIKLRFDAERSMSGIEQPKRRLTKPELRAQGTNAKTQWDRDHGPH